MNSRPTVRAPVSTMRGLVFDGPSTELASSCVVPVLDVPIEPGKSLVWCASFAMAWQAFSRAADRAPVVLQGQEDLCNRLTNTLLPDLPRASYWTWAGPADADGWSAALRSFAMWRPNAEPFEVPAVADGIAAVARLDIAVPFARGFNVADAPLLFRDARGEEWPVRAFGLRERDRDAYRAVRRQVQVLHAGWAGETEKSLYEFVIDPDRTTAPYQILLACVEPRRTLQEMWSYVSGLLGEPASALKSDRLAPSDTLLVPEMNWRVVHRFRDLEGPERRVAGTNIWLAVAQQEIRFSLDRSGAAVRSWSGLVSAGGPSRYEFDRPFLVVVKPRHRGTPAFLMWVGSAELLTPMAAELR